MDCTEWVYERDTGLLAELRDPVRFAEVRVNPEFGFIEWPNGVDICPDTLYEEAHPMANSSAKSPLRVAGIFTGPALVDPITVLCREILPEYDVINVVDDSLIRDVIAAGHVTPAVARRMVRDRTLRTVGWSARRAGMLSVMLGIVHNT